MAETEQITQVQNDNDVVIKVEHLTKDYGGGRGIFDVSFEVKKGVTFGYCGTNGSGKTTTLRHIMGFIKPDSGKVTVYGLDPWKHGDQIKNHIGYLPGEIAFPPVESGSEFLKIQAEMIGLTDMSKAERIINALQLDPTANLKRMSKGMKQKTAIVCAFMHSPDILILDEPTTGLDPLMREAFVNLIKEERAKGTTIIMSNHMFDELESTCDYVGFIKNGKLVDIVDMNKIHNREERVYAFGFRTDEEYNSFDRKCCTVVKEEPERRRITVSVPVADSNKFLDEIKNYNIRYMDEKKYTLEQYFMENIAKGENEND